MEMGVYTCMFMCMYEFMYLRTVCTYVCMCMCECVWSSMRFVWSTCTPQSEDHCCKHWLISTRLMRGPVFVRVDFECVWVQGWHVVLDNATHIVQNIRVSLFMQICSCAHASADVYCKNMPSSPGFLRDAKLVGTNFYGTCLINANLQKVDASLGQLQ